jgi:hypothetical protein
MGVVASIEYFWSNMANPAIQTALQQQEQGAEAERNEGRGGLPPHAPPSNPKVATGTCSGEASQIKPFPLDFFMWGERRAMEAGEGRPPCIKGSRCYCAAGLCGSLFSICGYGGEQPKNVNVGRRIL